MSINQSIYLNQENPQNNKNSTEKHSNKACKNRQTDRQRKCNWQSTI